MTRPGVDFEHSIPCPARVGPKTTGDLPTVGAAPRFSPLWSATGWWSNCDIYLEVPGFWSDVILRLYSLTGAVRSLIAETTVAASGMQQQFIAGPYRGIALSGRGHPGSGWIVEAASTNAVLVMPAGTISGELWGTESTPEGLGPTPAHSITDARFPSRASHLMGWPGGFPPAPGPLAGPWLPLACTADGVLIVDTGGIPPAPPAPARAVVDLGATNGAAIPLALCVLSATCANKHATATRYLQFFASAAAPLPGAVPALVFTVPPLSTVGIGADFFTPAGLPLSPLAWGFSSTELIYTPGLAANQTTQIVVKP